MESNTNYIRFWGVRGSYPTPYSSHMRIGGNTCCVEFHLNNHSFICDGGSGVIALGNDLMAREGHVDATILITHYHWDHIAGLPFFVPAFVPGTKLKIFGPGKDDAQIEERISGQMRPPYFPVETETWMADIEYMSPDLRYIKHGDIEIFPFVVHHPGTTFGFHFQINDKKVVHIPDNEFAFLDVQIDEKIAQSTSDEETELLLELKAEYRQQSINHLQGADILIHDAQYTPEDYKKKRGWGHSNYIDTVQIAIDSQVKELILFHADPSYDDDKVESIEEHARQIVKEQNSDLICRFAREEMKIEIY